MTSKQFGALFAKRHAELVEKIKRLEFRQKDGWGYKKIRRRGYRVRAHNVRAHYAIIPVKKGL